MEITREAYIELAKLSYCDYYGRRVEELPSNDKDLDHIVYVAASVMMDRDGFIPGGGFVQAINRNDLAESISRADATCIKHLPFFVYCRKFSDIGYGS